MTKKKPMTPLQDAFRRIENIGDSRSTHFLCPDSGCKLFTDPTRHIPCEGSCPRKAKIAMLCWHCHKAFVLKNDCRWCRVECPYCNACTFERMSGHYRRIDLHPKRRHKCPRN